MDFSISTKPILSNSHKRHCTDTERSTGSKRTRPERMSASPLIPDRVQTRLLNQLTTKQHLSHPKLAQWLSGADGFDGVMECLTEADALHLACVGKPCHAGVMAFYNARMKLKLPDQPDPLPLRHGFQHDPSAQWTIVAGSLLTETVTDNLEGALKSRHYAKLHRHTPEQSDPSTTRPRFGPKWKICHIDDEPDQDTTYHARLEPIGDEFNHPAFLYRDLMNRRDRFIPTDQGGRHWLDLRLIHHPLTWKIRNEPGMKVAKAEHIVATNAQEIEDALASGRLSRDQMEMFKNPLFTEHVRCTRLSLQAARNLTDNPMILFYCLSLLPLFRSGAVQLSDIHTMSVPGIQMLHDPRLVRLFCNGVLNVEQVKSLTPTQYLSIVILYQPLLQRCLDPQRVLALRADQIALLRKAGLLEALSAGRIALSTALSTALTTARWPAQRNRKNLPNDLSTERLGRTAPPPKAGKVALKNLALLMSQWPASALRRAFWDASQQGDAEWIAAFQRISQFLPDIAQLAIPEFDLSYPPSTRSSSSSSFNLPWLVDSLKCVPSGKSHHSKTTPASQKERLEQVTVSGADVALVLGRMRPELFHAAISGEGFGGNAEWLSQFGQVIHLMPLAKILALLNTKEKDSELFASFEEGLGSEKCRAVAQAFNQIVINLGAHLNGADYLQLASSYLQNVFGYMIAEAVHQDCPEIVNQCREIWSLVVARCQITGQELKKYFDVAMTSASEDFLGRIGYDDYGGTGDEDTGAAFACFLVNMAQTKNEKFLKTWSARIFDEDRMLDGLYDFLLGELGNDCFAVWHALLSPLRQSEYGKRAFGFMSNALREEPDVVVEMDEASTS